MKWSRVIFAIWTPHMGYAAGWGSQWCDENMKITERHYQSCSGPFWVSLPPPWTKCVYRLHRWKNRVFHAVSLVGGRRMCFVLVARRRLGFSPCDNKMAFGVTMFTQQYATSEKRALLFRVESDATFDISACWPHSDHYCALCSEFCGKSRMTFLWATRKFYRLHSFSPYLRSMYIIH